MEFLGKKAQDSVTKFSGVIVSEHTYLGGHKQYGLQSKVDSEGKQQPVVFVDSARLILEDGEVAS